MVIKKNRNNILNATLLIASRRIKGVDSLEHICDEVVLGGFEVL